jgi:large subunit ribosomal protein L24
MQKKFKIKKNDNVKVIAGKAKGSTGKVTVVDKENERVKVEGANLVSKHKKPTQTAQGGIEKREAFMHISNVMHLDPELNKPTKVGYKFNDEGKKVRYYKKSGKVISEEGK